MNNKLGHLEHAQAIRLPCGSRIDSRALRSWMVQHPAAWNHGRRGITHAAWRSFAFEQGSQRRKRYECPWLQWL